MKPGVLLHVGAHKTGTTSIQWWLRDHPVLLASHGIRFPRGWLRLNNHFELPLTLMRLDRECNPRLRGDDWRDPGWRLDVLRQVWVDLNRHADKLTVLSAETLSLFRYDEEFELLRDIVGDARIVFYKRERDGYLASLRAQVTKAGMPGVSDDPEAWNYCGADAWHADFDRLAVGWRRHFTQVWTPSYDAVVERDGSVVPSFVRHLGVPVPSDALAYRLNGRNDPVPRTEGNRNTNGLLFGEG